MEVYRCTGCANLLSISSGFHENHQYLPSKIGNHRQWWLQLLQAGIEVRVNFILLWSTFYSFFLTCCFLWLMKVVIVMGLVQVPLLSQLLSTFDANRYLINLVSWAIIALFPDLLFLHLLRVIDLVEVRAALESLQRSVIDIKSYQLLLNHQSSSSDFVLKN